MAAPCAKWCEKKGTLRPGGDGVSQIIVDDSLASNRDGRGRYDELHGRGEGEEAPKRGRLEVSR